MSDIRKRLSAEDRKKEIQNAASKQFLKKGFKNTTMEDVIEQTTMSKGGVYHYYSSTRDILYDIMIEGTNYRYNLTKEKIDNYYGKTIEDLAAALIVDRMIDDNEFMDLYVMFLIEAKSDEKLKTLFNQLKEESIETFKDLLSSFDTSITEKIVGDFLIDFVNTFMIGTNILNARDNFKENREVLIEMIKVYFTLKINEEIKWEN